MQGKRCSEGKKTSRQGTTRNKGGTESVKIPGERSVTKLTSKRDTIAGDSSKQRRRGRKA